jgi:hypothetical protein
MGPHAEYEPRPCPDLRSGRREGLDQDHNVRCFRTGSELRLSPRLRGQPFQAGSRVFACLGLAPEQLVGLGQHQRVRAAELLDLMPDGQLGGPDLVLDVLAAGLGERPLQRALDLAEPDARCRTSCSIPRPDCSSAMPGGAPRKLGTHRRAGAVERARALGLLAPAAGAGRD